MTQDDVAITGEPITDDMCRFSVDRPVYPEKSFYFGSKEQAEGSALAERLFAIEGFDSNTEPAKRSLVPADSPP